MNEAIVSIAKEFQNAKNGGKQFEGFLIGDVVAELPDIKIQIDPAIILDKTNLIFAERIYNGVGVGRKLILIPSSNDNMYVVIDKAVNL